MKFLALLLFLSCQVGAQDATSIRGIQITLPPSFNAEPMPSGDTSDGFVLSMDPATGTLIFKRAHISAGPSALTNNLYTPCRKHTAVAGPVGEFGMRTGLVAYIPPGVWNLQGQLTFAGPSNTEVVVLVWQGHGISPDPARFGIVSENAQIIGGGAGTAIGPAHVPFTVPFAAHLIQYMGLPGTANEITVTVYPKCDYEGGAVLGSISPDFTGQGFVPANFLSSFMITRVRGP